MTACLSMAGTILPLQTATANCWQEVMPYMEALTPTKYETTAPSIVEMMRCINHGYCDMPLNTNKNQLHSPYEFNQSAGNGASQLPARCGMYNSPCLYPQGQIRFNWHDDAPRQLLQYGNQIAGNNLPFLDSCWNK